MTKPIVAIVGRPNVGKSALFNRLAGRRIAIVEDLPGTTRDRIYADASWEGKDFTLIDTGGLELRPGSAIGQRVKEQVELAIEEADAIVFLVDVQEGVTAADLEAADMLRRSHKPIVLAANKADNPRRRAEAVVFHELGIGDPIPVSALHGTGCDDLLDTLIAKIPPSPPSPIEPDLLKTAIVGRPNVGKSMLLNAILGKERAIVNEAPGTTRDALDSVLHYDGQRLLLIDTAGIRRRGRIEPGLEHYSVLRALRAIDRADVALLVTEAPEPITAQDLHIAGYIHQAFKGMVVVVNKWDLAGDKKAADLAGEIQKRLKFMPQVPVLFVSAKLGSGVDQVLPAAQRVGQERQKRLPTAKLNGVIGQAVAAHVPPRVGTRQLKVLYVTQAEVNPPTFVFFVNDPSLVHFSYERYLENKLRQSFGFAGTSIRLIFKGRREA